MGHTGPDQLEKTPIQPFAAIEEFSSGDSLRLNILFSAPWWRDDKYLL